MKPQDIRLPGLDTVEVDLDLDDVAGVSHMAGAGDLMMDNTGMGTRAAGFGQNQGRSLGQSHGESLGQSLG